RRPAPRRRPLRPEALRGGAAAPRGRARLVPRARHEAVRGARSARPGAGEAGAGPRRRGGGARGRGGQRRGPAARGPVRPQGAGGAGQAAGGSGTMTSPRPAVKPLIVAVDDDPAVLAAVSRDLRRHYGESYRVV